MDDIKDKDIVVEEEKQGTESASVNGQNTVQHTIKIDGMFVDILNAVKMWFSKQPLKAFSKRLELKASLVLLVMHVLISVIMMLISSNNILGLIPGFRDVVKFAEVSGRLFFPYLISHCVYYAILISSMMVTTKIMKTPYSSYINSMSLVSIALIPVTFLNFVGFILGFINPVLNMVAAFVGLIVYFIALYMGLQVHLGKPKNSPFWIFPLAILACVALLLLFLYLYVSGMINSVRQNFSF